MRSADVVHLPDGSDRDDDSGDRQRVALALVGGDAGIVRYAAPLLQALGLAAHVFVPVEQLGRPGKISLRDLESFRHLAATK